jgi:hypothetical protein
VESPRGENPFKSEVMISQAFLEMKTMVEELYMEQNKKEEGQSQGKGEGGGGDPPKTPLSPCSPSSSSSSSITQKKQPEKVDSNFPTLKLDMKFDFPMYNGEINSIGSLDQTN